MKITKSSNPVRLIAFFLTAFLLVCTFGFTVDGWQMKDNGQSDSSQAVNNGDSYPSDDEINSEEHNEDIQEPEIYIPQFVNRLTGLETSEEIANAAHIAFILNPDLQSYGISGADLICQIPTENGVRTVAFLSEKEMLWKIGSIAKTRGYISNIVKYFGGICISDGSDDTISYNYCDINNIHLDLSLNGSYRYTEFSNKIYTNSELLSAGIIANGLNVDEAKTAVLPYGFVDFGSEPLVIGEEKVTNIILSNQEGSSSRICYNEDASKYIVFSNSSILTDSINGKQVEFENCFVLFADSVTYDNSQCTQMVMETIGSGVGYYITRGGVCEINWSSALDGTMQFSLLNGAPLTINRGNVYIVFQKSSMKDKIIFE